MTREELDNFERRTFERKGLSWQETERLIAEARRARADADRLADALRAGKFKWVSVDEYAHHEDPLFPDIVDALAAHDAEVAGR